MFRGGGSNIEKKKDTKSPKLSRKAKSSQTFAFAELNTTLSPTISQGHSRNGSVSPATQSNSER